MWWHTGFFVRAEATVLPVRAGPFHGIVPGAVHPAHLGYRFRIEQQNFYHMRSTDAVNFTAIRSVSCAGNSSMGTDYSFTDTWVTTDIIYYYRFRQTDIDGSAAFTGGVKQAKIGNRGITMTLMPNPVGK